MDHSAILADLIEVVWPEQTAGALWDRDRALTGDDADALITFLEQSPFFFRSGYAKPIAIKRLRKCPLNGNQRRRLFLVLKFSSRRLERADDGLVGAGSFL